eukprot:INCI4767.1.p1 GENE.INCI4767.1~~INCI4767.1.p1  ORF type:complete len:403 (-),score=68.27 INCI4767.1:535-1743(-)
MSRAAARLLTCCVVLAIAVPVATTQPAATATTAATTTQTGNTRSSANWSAPAGAAWPLHVQPFFLSATGTALTPAQAKYVSQFPVAVINHKQSADDPPRNRREERKQLDALASIKRANESCTTLFYLNSFIDFENLDLHQAFAQVNGSWWLKDDNGSFVMQHGGSYTFDWTVPEAREVWLDTALVAMANSSVDGIFVDKAKAQVSIEGLSARRLAAWNSGHDQLLADLRSRAPSNDSVIILNNRHGTGEGQLFERWGAQIDHDLLNITQDIAQLSENSQAGVLSLARAGGATPGVGGDAPDPQACAAGLAAMLVAVAAPRTAFFTCALDFNSDHTWLSLLNESIYTLPLGAPAMQAEWNATTGLMTRRFTSGTVAVVDPRVPYIGCVKWGGGETTGKCPDSD